jgi:peptidoglycan/LPS O-acetylase OafA/YrhL
MTRGPTVAQAVEECGGVGPGFNGLRLICALAVVVSHAFDYTGNSFEPFRWFSGTNRSLGGTAVYVFFLISGFLVTMSYFRSRSIPEFTLRRASRIFPAVFAIVALTALVLGPAMTTKSTQDYFGDREFGQYLWNLLLVGGDSLPGVFGGRAVIGTIWTLRHEVVCYALLALVARRLLARHRGFAVVALLLIGAGWWAVDRQLLMLEPFRVEIAYLLRFIAYFAAGTAIYVFRKAIVLDGRLAVVASLLSILALRFGALHLFFPFLGAYLVAYLGLRCRLSSGPFEHNDYSYGLYLYAATAQVWVIVAVPEYNVWWFNLLVSVPLGFFFAALSWHLVERPALSWVRRSQGLRTTRHALGVTT